MAEESLSVLMYGPAGAGKTTLSLTGPKPILFLDAETASRFIPRTYRKIKWNPQKDKQAPTADGSWDICVVSIKNWESADSVVKILGTHKHQFQTVVVDSVSEILVKAKDAISTSQFKIQDWGALGQNMGKFLRALRDITADENSSIRMLALLSATKEYNIGTDTKPVMQFRPLLEGSVKDTIQYLYDILAYIELEDVPVDPSNPGKGMTKLQTFFTGSSPNVASKSRPPGVPPTLHNITLEGLLNNIFGGPEEAPDPRPAGVDKDGVVEDNITKKEQPFNGLPV